MVYDTYILEALVPWLWGILVIGGLGCVLLALQVWGIWRIVRWLERQPEFPKNQQQSVRAEDSG